MFCEIENIWKFWRDKIVDLDVNYVKIYVL